MSVKIKIVKKLILLIFSILLLHSCCKKNNHKKNKYELYGNVTKLVEYTSLKNSELTKKLESDTTGIKTVFFKNGLRTKTIGYNTFNQDTIITKLIYDENNRKTQEKVILSDGTNFIVHYKYKDTLVDVAITRYKDNEISLNYKSKCFYNNKGIIKKNETKQLIIGLESQDTIQNFVETIKYNSKGYSKSSQKKYHNKSNLIEKNIFKRDCNGFHLSTKSYKNDELISKIKYVYTFDLNGNWIESKEFVNDTLNIIIERVITYE